MPARPLPAPSAPRARPRDAPARSGQRTIRGGFFQPLARVREMRKRGAGNARFAAAFFSPSRASARRASGRPQIPPASPYQPLARVRETRQRGAGNARFAAAFFSPLRASGRRESAERATRDSRRFHSAPRAHPGDAPARSRQRSNRGAFPQSPARVRETRKRGVGNARFAAAFFNPSRASGRRESAERETCESRRLFSAPCARPRDAKARSGQHAIRGSFLQPLARIRETRKRGAGNARFAAAFIQHLARVREMRQCGVGNVRIAVLSFSPSRASGRRASAE